MLGRGQLNLRIHDFVEVNGRVSLRDVYRGLDEDPRRVSDHLRRLWRRGFLLRTKDPEYVFGTKSRGRAGVVGNTRAVYYYALNNGQELPFNFIEYKDRKKDGRNREHESKAQKVVKFLREHSDEGFHSRDLRDKVEVKRADVMLTGRRYERKGWFYIRGYQSHDQRSPFKKGFILTWIDQEKPRDQAIKEAFERTSRVLSENATSNSIHEKIRLIRDQLLTANELLSFSYLRTILKCDVDKAKRALRRARQLYSDIKQVKIFGKFAYYYLDPMKPEDLKANIEMKKNYIRIRFGRENRIGHNWEAVVEWFIDKFTEGAEFLQQNHRRYIDPRRITLHLLKPVGERKQSAEVDRVWKVTPGLFSPTVTYVLECKYSTVSRRTLDDFIEVLKWSTDFGCDTEKGREVMKGVIPVFGAGAYNPKENVVVNKQKITLAQYASRMNIRLLRPVDFNSKLREHSVEKKITVQKVCRVAKNEKDVRKILDDVWKNPKKAKQTIEEVIERNHRVFEFETKICK